MINSYGKFKDFEIRDVVYFDNNHDNKIRFDIIKWFKDEKSGKDICFSIGFLEWNDKEPCFELQSGSLRWLEYSTEELNQWLLKWCEMKSYEILKGNES